MIFPVTNIGEYAFKNCKSLKTISLPKSCKELKKKTFSGCSSLLSVIMPEGINQIWGAFSDCVSIKSMVLPESTTQLVGSTFWGCSSLLEIIIPKKITSISWAAFIDCHSLQSFIVSKDNPVFSSDEGILFSKSKNEIVRYPPAKIGSTYIIPNEIEHISHCAFQGCKHLQTLILNSNVVSIGDSAFSSCSLLNSLFLSKSIKNIGRSILGKCDSLDSIKCNIDNINEINLCPDAFDGIDYSKVKLIIPEKTKETYTSHPTFSKFQNIIETETISPITGLSRKKSVNQLVTELNLSYITINEDLKFLNLPEVSLSTKLDMKDAEFLIKYYNSDEMNVIFECYSEIRKKRKELKSFFLRIYSKIDDMGEFGKRQLYNLIKMKEWNNPDRPQTKDYTQESFEELINWYIKWHKLENFELQDFEKAIIDEIE